MVGASGSSGSSTDLDYLDSDLKLNRGGGDGYVNNFPEADNAFGVKLPSVDVRGMSTCPVISLPTDNLLEDTGGLLCPPAPQARPF